MSSRSFQLSPDLKNKGLENSASEKQQQHDSEGLKTTIEPHQDDQESLQDVTNSSSMFDFSQTFESICDEPSFDSMYESRWEVDDAFRTCLELPSESDNEDSGNSTTTGENDEAQNNNEEDLSKAVVPYRPPQSPPPSRRDYMFEGSPPICFSSHSQNSSRYNHVFASNDESFRFFSSPMNKDAIPLHAAKSSLMVCEEDDLTSCEEGDELSKSLVIYHHPVESQPPSRRDFMFAGLTFGCLLFKPPFESPRTSCDNPIPLYPPPNESLELRHWQKKRKLSEDSFGEDEGKFPSKDKGAFHSNGSTFPSNNKRAYRSKDITAQGARNSSVPLFSFVHTSRKDFSFEGCLSLCFPPKIPPATPIAEVIPLKDKVRSPIPLKWYERPSPVGKRLTYKQLFPGLKRKRVSKSGEVPQKVSRETDTLRPKPEDLLQADSDDLPQAVSDDPPQVEPDDLPQAEPDDFLLDELDDLLQAEPDDLPQVEPDDFLHAKPDDLLHAELLHAEPDDLLHTEPDELLHAKPDDLLQAEPDDLLQAEPDDLLHAEPDDLLNAEPDDLLNAEPDDLLQAEPDDLLHAEPDDLLQAEPDDIPQAIPDDLLLAEPEDLLQSEQDGPPEVDPNDLPDDRIQIDQASVQADKPEIGKSCADPGSLPTRVSYEKTRSFSTGLSRATSRDSLPAIPLPWHPEVSPPSPAPICPIDSKSDSDRTADQMKKDAACDSESSPSKSILRLTREISNLNESEISYNEETSSGCLPIESASFTSPFSVKAEMGTDSFTANRKRKFEYDSEDYSNNETGKDTKRFVFSESEFVLEADHFIGDVMPREENRIKREGGTIDDQTLEDTMTEDERSTTRYEPDETFFSCRATLDVGPEKASDEETLVKPALDEGGEEEEGGNSRDSCQMDVAERFAAFKVQKELEMTQKVLSRQSSTLSLPQEDPGLNLNEIRDEVLQSSLIQLENMKSALS